MINEALMPCPFCESDDTLRPKEHGPVNCCSCGATAPNKAAWNTRPVADTPARSVRVKELVWEKTTEMGELYDCIDTPIDSLLAYKANGYTAIRQASDDGVWLLRTPDGKGQIASPYLKDAQAAAQVHFAALEDVPTNHWKANAQSAYAALNCVEEAMCQILPIYLPAETERGHEPQEQAELLINALHQLRSLISTDDVSGWRDIADRIETAAAYINDATIWEETDYHGQTLMDFVSGKPPTNQGDR